MRLTLHVSFQQPTRPRELYVYQGEWSQRTLFLGHIRARSPGRGRTPNCRCQCVCASVSSRLNLGYLSCFYLGYLEELLKYGLLILRWTAMCPRHTFTSVSQTGPFAAISHFFCFLPLPVDFQPIGSPVPPVDLPFLPRPWVTRASGGPSEM